MWGISLIYFAKRASVMDIAVMFRRKNSYGAENGNPKMSAKLKKRESIPYIEFQQTFN